MKVTNKKEHQLIELATNHLLKVSDKFCNFKEDHWDELINETEELTEDELAWLNEHYIVEFTVSLLRKDI